MPLYQITRTGEQAATYQVTDASEITYIDNDCIGDFKRGLYDDSVDRLLPFAQMTIRTHCGTIKIFRIN